MYQDYAYRMNSDSDAGSITDPDVDTGPGRVQNANTNPNPYLARPPPLNRSSFVHPSPHVEVELPPPYSPVDISSSLPPPPYTYKPEESGNGNCSQTESGADNHQTFRSPDVNNPASTYPIRLPIIRLMSPDYYNQSCQPNLNTPNLPSYEQACDCESDSTLLKTVKKHAPRIWFGGASFILILLIIGLCVYFT